MGIAVRKYEVLEKEQKPPQKSPPVSARVKSPRLTFDQARELAGGRIFELIHGRIVFKRADNKHADAQALLGAALVNYFTSNRIGIVRTEFTHRFLPDNPYESRVPDLSIILNENLKPEEKYASRAPDIAIEIISSDDRWTALFEKAKLYIEKGSQEVWLVDPYQRGVLIITSSSRRWEWKELASTELLPGFHANLQDLFTWPAAAVETSASEP